MHFSLPDLAIALLSGFSIAALLITKLFLTIVS